MILCMSERDAADCCFWSIDYGRPIAVELTSTAYPATTYLPLPICFGICYSTEWLIIY